MDFVCGDNSGENLRYSRDGMYDDTCYLMVEKFQLVPLVYPLYDITVCKKNLNQCITWTHKLIDVYNINN